MALMKVQKVVVLGASGGCGKQLVEQAHAKGLSVRAVVRPSSTFEFKNVETRRGDLSSVAFLTDCFNDQDIVLSALGLRMPGLAPWARPEVPDFLDTSTPAIIEAMRAAQVKRVMAISAGGVGDSHEGMPGMFKFFIAASALRIAYAALDRMEKTYLASGLDVCLPRPTGLTDGPRTGLVLSNRQLTGRATISRADVAGWMLKALEQPTFMDRTPLITVTGAA